MPYSGGCACSSSAETALLTFRSSSSSDGGGGGGVMDGHAAATARCTRPRRSRPPHATRGFGLGAGECEGPRALVAGPRALGVRPRFVPREGDFWVGLSRAGEAVGGPAGEGERACDPGDAEGERRAGGDGERACEGEDDREREPALDDEPERDADRAAEDASCDASEWSESSSSDADPAESGAAEPSWSPDADEVESLTWSISRSSSLRSWGSTDLSDPAASLELLLALDISLRRRSGMAEAAARA